MNQQFHMQVKTYIHKNISQEHLQTFTHNRQTLETIPTILSTNRKRKLCLYDTILLSSKTEQATDTPTWRTCETCAKSETSQDTLHTTIYTMFENRNNSSTVKKTPKMQEEGVQPEKETRNLLGVMKILYILIGVGITKVYILVNSI